MKNNGSLGYLTREGMRNLYVNRLMSMASVSVLFSCMVMIGVAFMIMVNINMFIGNVEDQNVIMVFVDDSATKAEEDELGASLRGLSNVRECTFVGKDSGFAQLKDEMGDSSVLFDGLDETRFPMHMKFRSRIRISLTTRSSAFPNSRMFSTSARTGSLQSSSRG